MPRSPRPAAALAVLLLARWVAAVRLRQPGFIDECPDGSACPEMQSSMLSAKALKAHFAADPLAMVRHSEASDEHEDWEMEVEPANVSLPNFRNPDMFVAVFSAKFKEARRHAARWAWHGAKRTTVKFIMCSYPPDPIAQQENKKYNDIAFIDCEEGYKHGILTKKLVATLLHYRKAYAQVPFFFKTDDDTFVRSGELLSAMKGANNPYVYGGLFYFHHNVPNRNPKSKWYQPPDVYPEKYYPASCAGGPGYVLSQALVDVIFNNSLPERYPLTNEDKAVGVWVNKAEEQTGLYVAKVRVAGTDGYRLNKCETFVNRTWSEYDLVLHHKVHPKELVCMGRAWQPSDRISQCFKCFEQ